MFNVYAFYSFIFKHLLVLDVLIFLLCWFFNGLFLETCLNRVESLEALLFIQQDARGLLYNVALSRGRGRGRGRDEDRERRRSFLTRLLSSFIFSPLPPLLLFLLLSSVGAFYLFFLVLRSWNVSVPQFEETVPGSCADAHPVIGDAGAAHPVVVAGENTWRRGMKRWWEKRGWRMIDAMTF